jgi:hypothetical protein
VLNHEVTAKLTLTHVMVVNAELLWTNVDSVVLHQRYGGLIVYLEG